MISFFYFILGFMNTFLYTNTIIFFFISGLDLDHLQNFLRFAKKQQIRFYCFGLGFSLIEFLVIAVTFYQLYTLHATLVNDTRCWMLMLLLLSCQFATSSCVSR